MATAARSLQTIGARLNREHRRPENAITPHLMAANRKTNPVLEASGILQLGSVLTLTMRDNLELQGYDQSRRQQFYQDLRRRLEILPGVQSASIGFPLPLDAYDWSRTVVPEGFTPTAGNERGYIRVWWHRAISRPWEPSWLPATIDDPLILQEIHEAFKKTR